MYCIHKIVGWVMSPMGMLFIGLAAAWALRRWRVLSRALVVLALALIWILGCGVTTRLIGLPLEGEEIGEGELEELVGVGGGVGQWGGDAIVLLGGGMGAHMECGRAEIFSGADRVWTAAKLWKKRVGVGVGVGGEVGVGGGIPIFCSGGEVEKSTVPLLTDLGVARESIVCLPQPRNTEEEARMIKEKLSHRCPSPTIHSNSNLTRPKVLLVTSAWHMPRAKMLFERVGFEVTPAPTDYEMHCAAEAPLTFGDFFPGAEALVRNSYAVKEWVARFCYFLKG